MEDLSMQLPNLERMIKMLAEQFGENSEFILHDLKRDYSNTIIAIENNHITGRNIGDGGTNLGLEVLRKPPHTNGDIYNYITETVDGRTLRSSTMYFRNSRGDSIGALCINTDITPHLNYQKELNKITMFDETKKVSETFSKNVGELVEFLIEESKKVLDKPSEEMTKEEKMLIVRFLDTKGFFLITHSGDEACKYLGISKYTLYKYLGEIREEQPLQ